MQCTSALAGTLIRLGAPVLAPENLELLAQAVLLQVGLGDPRELRVLQHGLVVGLRVARSH
eukprot:2623238-Alexandrium_andersonii.AAC.1